VTQRLFARLAVIPGLTWLVLLFLVPFALLLATSFATTNILGQPVYQWTTSSWTLALESGFLPTFVRSIWYAAAATAICLVLGYTVAYTVARYGGRYRSALILIVLVPWFVDYLIRIYSWIQLIGPGGTMQGLSHALGFGGQIDLLGHSYTVVGGLAYNFMPYMILSLYFSIDQLDGKLIEAGQDLYGSPWMTLLKVTVPCTLPGIISGCMLVFLPSVGDYATAQLLGAPDQYMIGNIISSETQTTGALPVAAAITVMLVSLVAAIVLVGALLTMPLRRRLGTAVVN
jgi:spermidine/putrescine transport system permease protein